MGKQFKEISTEQSQFIKAQKIFFVGTAMSTGKVNVSPKGMDSFRILSPTRILWLNLTGSGNETAAHLLENDRMTIMFCAFEGKPMILRLYGTAKTYHPRDKDFNLNISLFPEMLGTRQIVDMKVDMVQTSCGFSIPLMDYKSDRDTLSIWADKKGRSGIDEYWEERNQVSLDGKSTGIIGQ